MGYCRVKQVNKDNQQKRKRLISYWQWFVAVPILIIFVVWVEYKFGWVTFLKAWQRLSPAAVVIALVLIFITYFLRTVRFYYYFYPEMRGRFRLCLCLFLTHNFFNSILPMRSGEIAFPILMKRWFSISMGRSVPGLLWFRFIDLHTLLILSIFAVLYGYVVTFYGIPLMFLLILLPVGFYLSRGIISNFIGDSEFRLWVIVKKLVNGIPSTPKVFTMTWILTVTNWVAKLSVFSWLINQFTRLTFHKSLFAGLVGEFTSVLPIHGLAGAGTYETGVAAPLKAYGVSLENSVQAAVNLHLFILSAVFIGGLTGFILKWLLSFNSE
ncbi:UPF0104 family protein [Candidatus Poribacteria bacterium]|nr:UPF0104 family protein [Candidatus Poribacteria bacterium]